MYSIYVLELGARTSNEAWILILFSTLSALLSLSYRNLRPNISSLLDILPACRKKGDKDLLLVTNVRVRFIFTSHRSQCGSRYWRRSNKLSFVPCCHFRSLYEAYKALDARVAVVLPFGKWKNHTSVCGSNTRYIDDATVTSNRMGENIDSNPFVFVIWIQNHGHICGMMIQICPHQTLPTYLASSSTILFLFFFVQLVVIFLHRSSTVFLSTTGFPLWKMFPRVFITWNKNKSSRSYPAPVFYSELLHNRILLDFACKITSILRVHRVIKENKIFGFLLCLDQFCPPPPG